MWPLDRHLNAPPGTVEVVPEPFRGLVAVAEFGSMFEAELAANSLEQLGIAATVSYDPAVNSVAPYFASDRVVEVVVREEDAEQARHALSSSSDQLPAEFQSSEVVEWSESRTRRARSRHAGHVAGRAALAAVLILMVLSGLLLAFRS